MLLPCTVSRGVFRTQWNIKDDFFAKKNYQLKAANQFAKKLHYHKCSTGLCSTPLCLINNFCKTVFILVSNVYIPQFLFVLLHWIRDLVFLSAH